MSVLEPVHQSNLAELAALSPPSRDLDRSIAVDVLSLPSPGDILGRIGWLTDAGFKELPHYSTDRIAWLDVLDEMMREVARWRKSYSMKGGTQFTMYLSGRLWTAHFHGYNPFPCYVVPAGQRQGVSIPHAICLAALNYAQVANAKGEWHQRGPKIDDEDVDW